MSCSKHQSLSVSLRKKLAAMAYQRVVTLPWLPKFGPNWTFSSHFPLTKSCVRTSVCPQAGRCVLPSLWPGQRRDGLQRLERCRRFGLPKTGYAHHRPGGDVREREIEMSNYMLHFALLLHVCSLPQALSLLLRMSQKVGSCRLHWLTVCLNTTALALVSKVTADFNVVAELRS